mmetsp:Transcript_38991/g.92009  ORF Transcript_38991/g.92009 Transcript_38991/m.92009 type:complete len:133 (+) Transcript_38991:73-471(+)
MENVIRKRMVSKPEQDKEKKAGQKTEQTAKTSEPCVIELDPGANVAAFLVVTLVLVVYILTMYPSVPGGDSGELIVAGCTVGIAHPPGYPLFTMLAVLFHGIPFGSPAWRINLLSVILSTGCAFFVFKTVLL